MRIKTTLAAVALTATALPATTQAQRLRDNNTIAWAASFNTIGLSKQVQLWAEYQYRRADFVSSWQQSLPRLGLQYSFGTGLSAMAGYAYITSYPYGDYPVGPYSVPEQRIFEQFVWNDYQGRVWLNHRLRLEQRFIGKVNQAAPEYEVTDWTYLNRLRYQLRVTVPLNHEKMEPKTWYAVAFDEIFIGFGKNVNQNVFDQNRLSFLVGYQFNKMIRLEGGWINQIVQQGGLAGGREVFQYNNGPMVALWFTRLK